MVRNRKKQSSVWLSSTLQRTRGTETNRTQTIEIITGYVQSALAKQQQELCLNLVLHSTSQLLNPDLCSSQDIVYHLFVISYGSADSNHARH